MAALCVMAERCVCRCDSSAEPASHGLGLTSDRRWVRSSAYVQHLPLVVTTSECWIVLEGASKCILATCDRLRMDTTALSSSFPISF